MSRSLSQPPSRLDPEPIPRRDLLGLASLWSAAGALAFAAVGMARLPKAAVLPSPSKKFGVELPDSLAAGEPFLAPGRPVVIYRDADGVYALSLVCTHLGCIAKPDEAGFECPCHGSRFAADGEVTKGPAPTALPWLAVSVSGGKVVVDEAAVAPAGTKVKA